jgi:hypothetical protein
MCSFLNSTSTGTEWRHTNLTNDMTRTSRNRGTTSHMARSDNRLNVSVEKHETRDGRLAPLLRPNTRDTPDHRTTVWGPLLLASGGQMLRSHDMWGAKGSGNRLFASIIKMRSQTLSGARCCQVQWGTGNGDPVPRNALATSTPRMSWLCSGKCGNTLPLQGQLHSDRDIF